MKKRDEITVEDLQRIKEDVCKESSIDPERVRVATISKVSK